MILIFLKTLMWDIKLILIEITFSFFWVTTAILALILDFFNTVLFNSFNIMNWQIGLNLPQNLSLIFGIKFCCCIAFLILIRGGTPRYRYDFLTKLGWLKFLSLILLVLIFSIFFIFLY